jgi:hypothetical protein
MTIRIALAVGLFAISSSARAEDGPDLKPFAAKLETLVKRHYPQAKFGLKDQTITFEYKTRKFWIHHATLTGEWQDAFEEIGPQKGGIVGELELRQGPYGGMAAVPQSFDVRYFTTLLTAPYSKKLDHHLYIHLKYPRDVSKEFAAEFDKLVNAFDEHVKK